MSIAENGSMVSVHYVGTLNNGQEFDSSLNREPLKFEIGGGGIIPGFNEAIVGMEIGEVKTITIDKENAYGITNPSAVQEVPKNRFPGDFNPVIGEVVSGDTQQGQTFHAKIVSIQDETITLNFNHPLAGEDLTFKLELVSIG
mgnify:CR=1 FL=1|tara:strand:+ start:77 stop:505 length:429 start_codon:yes stop_codon:yes gene_type:complete